MTTTKPTAGRRGPKPAAAPSDRVREAVLGAARDLVEADGFFGLTVDGLVARSGISKATIYRWWANRAAVALDMVDFAYGTPAAVLGGPRAVTTAQGFVRAEVAYLAGPAGPVLAGLLADAQRDPGRAEILEDRYLAPRRVRLRTLLASEPGISDPALTAQCVEAAIYYRLLSRADGLTRSWANQVCRALLGSPHVIKTEP